MKQKIYIILIAIALVGALLRFYKLADNPVSLNIDEVSYGYDAYSILKTGRDQYGNFMPIIFKSVGDYKNPVLIYLTVPSIAIFGLNEFGVRFPTALFGTLSIPLLFFLIKSLLKDNKLALAGAGLLAISPWHIYYSRFASDHLLGLFFTMLGMLFFQKMLRQSKYFLIAAFFLSLSIYTYHSQRVFIPLFILGWLITTRVARANKKYLAYFIITSFIFCLPLLYLSIFGQANVRAAMVFITQDIDFTRYVVLDHLFRQPFGLLSNEALLLPFFTISRYLGYFQPDFLFFHGLNMTISSFGLGVVYLFELPWLIIGAVKLIRERLPNFQIILLWILIGFIPVALTNNVTDAGRSLLAMPALAIISALGAISCFKWATKPQQKFKWIILSGYGLFIAVIIIQAFLVFSVHFPIERGEASMEGTKQTVLYTLANKNKYSEIIYDPYRGVAAGDIVNIPHMYILFYSQYDPALYQKEVQAFTETRAHFDKFTIRRIDWRTDKYKTGTLFIGSPWSLPLKDLRPDQILDRIYLTNGQLALLIVSP